MPIKLMEHAAHLQICIAEPGAETDVNLFVSHGACTGLPNELLQLRAAAEMGVQQALHALHAN
jgi:hypothetical protein